MFENFDKQIFQFQKKKDDKPDWSKKNKDAKAEDSAPAAVAPEAEPVAEEAEAEPEAGLSKMI